MSGNTGSTDRAQRALDILELDIASDFVEAVQKFLRRLSDDEIAMLYLMTHTDSHFGQTVHQSTAALMPIIEHEFDLRRDLTIVPYLGPKIAPELYLEGGGYYVPF